jgi:hypothetical protein
VFLNGAWLVDSDRLRFSVSGDGYLSGSAQHERTSSSGPYGAGSRDFDESQRNRNAAERLHLAVGLRHYPWEAPIGWSLDAAGYAYPGQSWNHSRSSEVDRDSTGMRTVTMVSSEVGRSYTRSVQVTAAIGAGRVRDATAVYETRAMEARLLRAGTLRRPLSREARARLAALLYAQSDYGAAHDRPDKFFWRDVEAILRDDGALAHDALDGYGTLRAEEQLEPLVSAGGSLLGNRSTYGSTRMQGAFVGIGLTGTHHRSRDQRHHTQSVSVTGGPTYTSDYTIFEFLDTQSELAAGPQAEWHRPLGLDWQVDAVAAASIPINHDHHDPLFISAATVRYLVADRWLARGATQLMAKRFRNADYDGSPGYSFAFGAIEEVELDYGIEDHVTIGLLAQGQQNHDLLPYYPVPSFVPHTSLRTEGIFLTLGYRILGSAEIPGTSPPIRSGLIP